MEAAQRIAKLEADLEAARLDLTAIRREKYKGNENNYP